MKANLPKRCDAPFKTGYRPETDVSDELNAIDTAYYQSCIGILRWVVELGRCDICAEVSMLASCLALPRVGHLGQVYQIFGYLKAHHNAEMVFDPSNPDIDSEEFKKQEWIGTVYGEDLSEDLPPDAPKPRGIGMRMRVYVDSDHAGDVVSRKSRTGFFVFLQNAPIYWCSKKQGGIETSSFGAEFIAMKTACEYVRGLRYKLRMMGIDLMCEPTFIYGDNQSVLCNTTLPDSKLKKKSNSVAYHYVREGVARDEWRTTYISTHENPADILTKAVPAGQDRRGKV